MPVSPSVPRPFFQASKQLTVERGCAPEPEPAFRAGRLEQHHDPLNEPALRNMALIVDDESEIRTMLAAIVRRLGYRAVCAGDGRAALTQFQTHADQIIVVLLDVNMPVMSGEETLRALKAIDPDVRVLLISGYAEADLGEQHGGPTVHFLQKPFTIAQIASSIAELVAVRPGS